MAYSSESPISEIIEAFVRGEVGEPVGKVFGARYAIYEGFDRDAADVVAFFSDENEVSVDFSHRFGEDVMQAARSHGYAVVAIEE